MKFLAKMPVFQPGKRLPPHRGPYNGVLRLHLGLLVPAHDSNLGIRIGTEVRGWKEGSVLIFDDAYEHEAWNETGYPRVVSFVDFEKPLRFPVNVLNHVLLRLAALTPYRCTTRPAPSQSDAETTGAAPNARHRYP
jgi:beta-hydroxylase